MSVKKKINRVIAIDLGNGLTNVRSSYEDGSPYSITLPSAFGFASNIGEAFGGAGEDIIVDYITVDGVEFVWGEDIHKVPQIIHTASLLEDRYETNNYKTFIKIVLGKVAKDIGLSPSDQVLVSTGVPSDQTKEKTVNAIRNALVGEGEDYKGLHKVIVGDEEYIINVAETTITPQPLATVLSAYLDDKGRIKDKDLTSKKIAIIDIGGGTTDLDTLLQFKRQHNFRSIGTGFRDVYKAIQDEIKKENDGREINVNDYVLLDIIQMAEQTAKETGEDPVYTYQGSDKQKRVDFTTAYINALRKVGMQINQAISDQWKDYDSFDLIFLVGGSAKRVAPYIEILQEPDFPHDPGKSNVEGYYNLGVSKMNANNRG